MREFFGFLSFVLLLIASLYADYRVAVAKEVIDNPPDYKGVEDDYPFIFKTWEMFFTPQLQFGVLALQGLNIILPSIIAAPNWVGFAAYLTFFTSLFWIAFDSIRNMIRGKDIFYPLRVKQAKHIREELLEFFQKHPWALALPKLMMLLLSLAYLQHIPGFRLSFVEGILPFIWMIVGGVIFVASLIPWFGGAVRDWARLNKVEYIFGFGVLILGFVVLGASVSEAAFFRSFLSPGLYLAVACTIFVLGLVLGPRKES